MGTNLDDDVLDRVAGNISGVDGHESSRVDQSQMPSRPKPAKGFPRAQSLSQLGISDDPRLNGLLEFTETDRRKEDLVLSRTNADMLLGLIEEFRRKDELRRHGLSTRSKLLFCGPPGCGKTITAEIFAAELNLPLFVLKLDAVISSFLGETAANLRRIFDDMKRRPAVLFLDEFDALARAREDNSEHNELRRVVNSLLMLIDRYTANGFLIAATNLERSLDSAIWRRFDEVLFFSPPSEAEISRLLRIRAVPESC